MDSVGEQQSTAGTLLRHGSSFSWNLPPSRFNDRAVARRIYERGARSSTRYVHVYTCTVGRTETVERKNAAASTRCVFLSARSELAQQGDRSGRSDRPQKGLPVKGFQRTVLLALF